MVEGSLGRLSRRVSVPSVHVLITKFRRVVGSQRGWTSGEAGKARVATRARVQMTQMGGVAPQILLAEMGIWALWLPSGG